MGMEEAAVAAQVFFGARTSSVPPVAALTGCPDSFIQEETERQTLPEHPGTDARDTPQTSCSIAPLRLTSKAFQL